MKNRLVGIFGSFLVIFGVFTPLLSFYTFSITLFDMGNDAIPFLIIALLVLIPSFLQYGLYQIIAGAGTMLLLAHEWNKDLLGEKPDIIRIAGLFMHKGIGFYLILFGGMIMCISGIISITKKKMGNI